MKILFVGIGKIMYMPYLNFYIEFLKNTSYKNEYHLFYWQRDNNPDLPAPSNFSKVFKYSGFTHGKNSVVSKIGHFLKFRKMGGKIIRTNTYDKIVFLHSVPAVLLEKYLKNKRIKYILDYRDFSHENLLFYKKIISRLVFNSEFTYISSPGFRKYLPKSNKIYQVHNISNESMDYFSKRKIINSKKETINISFWGRIRHYKINKLLISKIANNNRFILNYHGLEQKDAIKLKKYCKKKNIKNVFFCGEYFPDERLKFANNTDLLHNFYDNNVRTINALGNKYYDGIVFKIPQLCNEGSFMGTMVSNSGLGISMNIKDPMFADKLLNYLNELNYEVFYNNCAQEMKKINIEQTQAAELLYDFFKDKK